MNKDDIDRLVKRLQTAIEVHLGAQKASHQYSRYEIRKLWPYTEQEISFETTTKLLREGRSGRGEEERKVDVEKLMENVRSYFLSKKKEEKEEKTLSGVTSICARDVFDSRESAFVAEMRTKVVHERRLSQTLRVELKKAKKESERAMKDISNRTEQNEEYVKQVYDSVETWMRKATEMEEERDSHRERCEKLEKENRMLRNGERFELLRKKMIVRERKLKERLEEALRLVDVLRLEGIEKDAELIRNRGERRVK